MRIVYEPKGRALEYSPLACNHYIGCEHGCKYCYAPGCTRTTKEKWYSQTYIRKNVIENFEKDAKTLQGSSKRILFSFLSDPYQPIEKKEHITHQCLEIVARYNLKSSILTKGDSKLIEADFDLYHKAHSNSELPYASPMMMHEKHGSQMHRRSKIVSTPSKKPTNKGSIPGLA